MGDPVVILIEIFLQAGRYYGLYGGSVYKQGVKTMMSKTVFSWLTAAVCMALLTGCGEVSVETVQKWQEAGSIPKLIAVTTPETDQDIRFAAITALGNLKAAEAVEPLATLFTDGDHGVVLLSIEAMTKIGTPPAHDRLIDVFELNAPRGRVFSKSFIETWIDYKRTNEVDAIRLRPHPWEFALYYDI